VLWGEEGFAWRAEWRVPNAAVSGLKQRAGALAHEFYGRPSEALWTCGVTGTNGKTSCSQWLSAVLQRKSVPSAVIGTLGTGFPGSLAAAANTTPDALELHRTLRDMHAAGARSVAMEVSSHGLVQGRVNGVRFACALLTNLSHDHLDYHGSMEGYAQAKARLFEVPGLDNAVLNLDDPFGVELARRLQGRVRTIGYSLEPVAAPADEKIVADRSWRLPVLGRFNVSNALGVLGCLVARGVSLREGGELLRTLPPVPGRMQRVADEPLVVVDYAHTPDALEKVLAALRPVAAERGGKLAVVFGAGGDRDPTKRAPMGAAAARLADRVIVTSDNPRNEDPLAIIAQIERGIAGGHEVEADRAKAIAAAIGAAEKQDVVLIAGKGHEDYQEIAGRRQPFSDAALARAAAAARGSK